VDGDSAVALDRFLDPVVRVTHDDHRDVVELLEDGFSVRHPDVSQHENQVGLGLCFGNQRPETFDHRRRVPRSKLVCASRKVLEHGAHHGDANAADVANHVRFVEQSTTRAIDDVYVDGLECGGLRACVGSPSRSAFNGLAFDPTSN
jgi:hypothetical protein